ncbi:hypothetical protein RF11_08817 [Thelohanellus kitauei]|uniref:ISXO2-like transposase domain-containing protein n=1 Tax=Thelohanellus kitauei TaxID=669202 RepID=A0A0C2MAJ0_THEKT|nr:hypothetical protein RF11_08817 [Thelohanellus kitauei]
MKLLEIIEICSSQEGLIHYLRSKNLLSNGERCPKCRQSMVLINNDDSKSKDGQVWRCFKSKCDKARSVRHRSFFKRSKLSLGKLLMILHLWAKQYPLILIQEDFDFSKQTIIDWARFCRDLCVEYFINNMHTKIGGSSKIVEIDESLLVRRKYNTGRLLKQQWMFGGIERSSEGERRFFIEFVDERTEEVLSEIILRRIDSGTKIISDGWKAYQNLARLGYQHEVKMVKFTLKMWKICGVFSNDF